MTDRYIERDEPLPANELKPHTLRDQIMVEKFRKALERAAREHMSTGRVALWLWQIAKTNGRQ